MNKTILAELFYGNVCPCEKRITEGTAYDKAIKKIAENEEQLMESLGGDDKDALLALLRAQSELNGITAFEHFLEGFRLGAKIMLEVLQG